MRRESFLDVQPELYSSKPNLYQIFDKQYGLYKKKDAELICEFLRNNMYKIITYKIINIKVEE